MTTFQTKSGLSIEVPQGLDERAESVFRDLAETIDAEKRWSDRCRIGLAQIAQLHVEIIDLQDLIRQNGLTCTTDKNQTARRVEVGTLNQCRTQLSRLLAMFKLTPIDAIPPKEEKPENRLFELARRRGITIPGMPGHPA